MCNNEVANYFQIGQDGEETISFSITDDNYFDEATLNNIPIEIIDMQPHAEIPIEIEIANSLGNEENFIDQKTKNMHSNNL